MVDHALASIDEVVSDSNTEDIRNDKKNKVKLYILCNSLINKC